MEGFFLPWVIYEVCWNGHFYTTGSIAATTLILVNKS